MTTETHRSPGRDTRLCPSARVGGKIKYGKGQAPGLIPFAGSDSAVDCLYGGMLHDRLREEAAKHGTIAARGRWYALRRKVLRVEKLAARAGYALDWTQPWPSDGLAVMAAIVRENRVFGTAEIRWPEFDRADVILRGMSKASI